MSPRVPLKGGNAISGLNQHYEEKVRPCIDLVDSLRSLGVEKDLNLPAIAVIGDQSSGKSSVLEALSGVALPRGTGNTSTIHYKSVCVSVSVNIFTVCNTIRIRS